MRWKKCIVVVGGGITGCGGGGGCHAAAVGGGEVDDESCAHDHRTRAVCGAAPATLLSIGYLFFTSAVITPGLFQERLCCESRSQGNQTNQCDNE